ncbi:unnamed protein product [Owenia fusiformis]|uniref:RING-type domain-containing protein n=1 Tax=Owenia fusiformis TaxID=6347 RepID=A0A8S4PAJ7_OWEFU|nr:unnamed protein product [Owenia fusiformis]
MADYRKIQHTLGLMQKNLECSICLELMRSPVSTKCDHQFCKHCISEYLQHKTRVKCPLCQKFITKRSLSERKQLTDIVDGVRAVLEAFNQDSGAPYTPPRGPVTLSQISCTPENIRSPLERKNHSRKRLAPITEEVKSTDAPVSIVVKNKKNIRMSTKKRAKLESGNQIYIEDCDASDTISHASSNTNISSCISGPGNTRQRKKKTIIPKMQPSTSKSGSLNHND